jgi:hypothetical protein
MASPDEPREEDGLEEDVIYDSEKIPRVGRTQDDERIFIAKILIWMMALGLVGHYVAVIAFEWNGKSESVKSLQTILNAWLPVVSGLVGAAVTYYFTRDRR